MTPVADDEGGHPAVMTLIRTFDAPRDLVYRLWTDPKYVALWWGIDGATNPTCQMDVRPGGIWRIDMRTADGTVYPNRFEYIEIVANERLVYTDIPVAGSPAWKGESAPSAAIHTVVFEEDGAATRVVLETRFASPADRDRVLKAGMKEGIGQSLDRFERLLRKIKADASEAPASARGA